MIYFAKILPSSKRWIIRCNRYWKVYSLLFMEMLLLSYNSLSNNDLLIYADVTNKDFLQSFEDLKPLLAMTGGQMQLNSTGKDQ